VDRRRRRTSSAARERRIAASAPEPAASGTAAPLPDAQGSRFAFAQSLLLAAWQRRCVKLAEIAPLAGATTVTVN